MRRFLPALIALPILLGSCNHYYYAPNLHNAPLFRGKGEVRVAVSAVGGDELEGVDMQAAATVTDHIGVMVNAVSLHGGDESVSDDGHGQLIEGGAGYFGTLDDRWAWEVYGGFGQGKVRNNYGPGNYSEMNVSRFFVQPAIGLTHKVFNFGVSFRIADLLYSNVRYVSPDPVTVNEDLDQISYIDGNRNTILLEPALHLRVGYKYVKFISQFVFVNNLSNYDLKICRFVASAGLQFHFAQYFMDKR